MQLGHEITYLSERLHGIATGGVSQGSWADIFGGRLNSGNVGGASVHIDDVRISLGLLPPAQHGGLTLNNAQSHRINNYDGN